MSTVTIKSIVAGRAADLALDNGTDLKIKLFTGTTGASEGGFTSIALGAIDGDKIVSIVGLVNWTGTSWMTGSYTKSAGYNFGAYVGGTDLTLGLHPTSSELILSKPFKILVTYYE